MPYLPTAQSWLENSTLLLSARPTTARITTKYTINRSNKNNSPPAPSNPASATPSTTAHQLPKASLVLKTYDPVSGTCLKYRTTKAPEVGRLIAALGTCGRVMAALPEKVELGGDREGEVGSEVVGAGVEEKGVKESTKEGGKGKTGVSGGGSGGGGGGGGKKKKGKR